MNKHWETVIGLEVHVQLATKTKIFSGSSTAFGAAPNTQACAIDLALPGTLPVLNEQAVKFATMFGLAVNAEISKRSVFERKNYFYPDLPKGYQTTQLEKPIVGAGSVEIQLADDRKKTIRIHHAHLEEDAGKSLHEDFAGMSGIDLNRAGTPLIEIVSEPDMRSAEEAVAYAKKLHSIVTSLGICDGDMSQGSMRFDVNISVRRKGEEKLGTRTETKNLNSFKFMEKAIAKEVERQIDILEDGGKIKQETRLYNGDTDTARSMRSKEEANDYRYFPCPDLLPVVLEDSDIEKWRSDLPELPDARQLRFMKQHQLSAYDASILADDTEMAAFFEETANHYRPLSNDLNPAPNSEQAVRSKLAANWCMGELTARLNAEDKTPSQSPVRSGQLAELIERIKNGTISSKMAKEVFDNLWQGIGSVDQIIEQMGGGQISDVAALETIVDNVIAANPQQTDNYRKATEDKRPKMLGFFVGQIMKQTQGKANPQQVNELLLKKLI
jgi:aspartyl-tRNA(Asn)/glutamyl-tRNA(Gln) amidotransferase subunit B